jgi:hypothetical protein
LSHLLPFCLRQRWSLIPAKTDIVITHMPPQNILDLAFDSRGDNSVCRLCGQQHERYGREPLVMHTEWLCTTIIIIIIIILDLIISRMQRDSDPRGGRYTHWGSRSLLDRVQEVRPLVHIFGHVHDSHG